MDFLQVPISHFVCISPWGRSRRPILGTQRSWHVIATAGARLRTLKTAAIALDGPYEIPVDIKQKTHGHDLPLYNLRSSACCQAKAWAPHRGKKKIWKGVVIVYTDTFQSPIIGGSSEVRETY